jgi:peptidoglycan/LPS O-acetylase OafA/YrhL
MDEQDRSTMTPQEKDHLELVDVLRGLMALWVFCAHLSVACTGKVLSWGPPSSSVDIFMFISGLLMAYHWTKRQHKFSDTLAHTTDFYIRRFFRIAPLYYLLLIVAFIGQDYFFEAREAIRQLVPPPWAAAAAGPNNPLDSSLTITNILSHFTFTFGFFPKYVANNILPDWSIGLEMQFYLIFPLLMVIIKRFGTLFMAAVGITMCLLAHKLFGVYFNPGLLGNYPQPGFILLKLNFFICGMCIALAYLSKDDTRKRIVLTVSSLLR